MVWMKMPPRAWSVLFSKRTKAITPIIVYDDIDALHDAVR